MKVLIFSNELELAPVGGPKGYLYSFKQGLENIDCSSVQIFFLHDENIYRPSFLVRFGKNTKNYFLKKIASLFHIYYHHKRLMGIMNSYLDTSIDFCDFDIIHFHATRDFYRCRNKLKNYKGITVLTSHSPQPLSHELIEEAGKLERKLFKKKYKSLIEMDRYSFVNADIILFPCEEADEPYVHEWPEYSDIKRKRKQRYRYLSTGTNTAVIKTDSIEVRKKLGIPKDAFVISYVGRHNEIKGYDRLKRIGKKFLKDHPDAYVIVAGREEPLKRLKHPRWIEIGWTNEPHSYVNASDVFILPNRETYFDLVMLEVLSIGKLSLISNTGGNKYYHRFKDAGIFYFEDEDGALINLNEIYNMPKELRKNKEVINREIYEENFTNEIFANNYIKFYESLAE